MLHCSLDLLSHELLDTLHENDSDESKDDEGDDGCPSESVCGGVGVVAGVKGGGEAGTTASRAAVMNAVADAGANIDMPATPERVWRALNTDAG